MHFNVWRLQVYTFLENQEYLWDYSIKLLETLYITTFRET